ncbi:MAG: IS1595 family transposase [Flavobacteriales bacterium]|nr:IS1595 family transposase [Flavobacteriales bacterium]
MKHFETLIQLQDHFASEQVCRDHLAALRWGADGIPCCPFCGVVGAYSIEKGKRFKCKDKGCAKKFSVTVGTVFENTKLPLRVWFAAIYLACNSSKGVSSLQLSRNLGITQKTGWFLLCRIREMLIERTPTLLHGVVEADETYIGGAETNKHAVKRTEGMYGGKGKAPVLGILERDGRVVVKPIENSKRATIQPIVRQHVAIGSVLSTDEHTGYKGMRKTYSHITVNHHTGEYVKGNAHTNGIENFWSLMKRGINGIYHQVSPKHLHRYCDEYAYRFNNRLARQEDKFNTAVFQADGRRLTYRLLIGKDKVSCP